MFSGFSQDTALYLNQIALDNSKSNYERLKPLYQSAVRQPLRDLHAALLPTVLDIDPRICIRPARCISGAFNDLRFSRAEPLKTYFYLHFIAERGRKDDLPGFFIDADCRSYRYGLALYHGTSGYMQAVREKALESPAPFERALDTAFSSGHAFAWQGEVFKRDRYIGADALLHGFLMRKSWCLACVPCDASALYTPALVSLLAYAFEALAPLYHCLDI